MSAVQDYLQGKTDRRMVAELGGSDRAMAARHDRILVAGALNRQDVLKELGCMEQATFYDGRSLADPEFVNPYWGK